MEFKDTRRVWEKEWKAGQFHHPLFPKNAVPSQPDLTSKDTDMTPIEGEGQLSNAPEP